MCSKQKHQADHGHKKGHVPRALQGHSPTGISRPRTEVLRTRAYFSAANTLLRIRASRGHLNLFAFYSTSCCHFQMDIYPTVRAISLAVKKDELFFQILEKKKEHKRSPTDKMIAQRTNSEAQRRNSEMPNGHLIGHLREYLHKNTYNTYKSVGLLLFLLFLGLSPRGRQKTQRTHVITIFQNSAKFSTHHPRGIGGAIGASSQELLPQHCPKRCISLQNSHMEH